MASNQQVETEILKVLKAKRKSLGMSLESVGLDLGKTTSSMSAIEKGTSRLPLCIATAMAAVYGVTFKEIVDEAYRRLNV